MIRWRECRISAATHTEEECPAYMAEVRALSAMFYYYVMDLFGRIPLIDTSDPAVEEMLQAERYKDF